MNGDNSSRLLASAIDQCSDHELIPDVLSAIFSKVDFRSLVALCCVCKKWQQVATTAEVSKQVIYNAVAFGPDQWAKYMHKEATDEEVQTALAMLPSDIMKILHSPCPVFPSSGKQVKDTHELVYIGTEMTLASLGALVEANLNSNSRKNKGYAFISPQVLERLDKPVEKGHWVLMSKDVLGGEDTGPEGSRGKTYAVQTKMVAELTVRSGENYMVPNTLEAVAVLIAHLLKSDQYIFGRGTCTFCKEKMAGGDQIVVGEFSPYGLIVDFSYTIGDSDGVAGLRKFFL